MPMPHRIFVACDHAGLELKNHLVEARPNLPWKDLGAFSNESVDYPDYADKMAKELKDDPKAIGVLVCGSGQGMAIRANRYPFIRAALCWSEESTRLAREHNDANILCLGGRFIGTVAGEKLLDIFLQTEFSGGRHERRVKKLKDVL